MDNYTDELEEAWQSFWCGVARLEDSLDILDERSKELEAGIKTLGDDIKEDLKQLREGDSE